MGTGKIYQGVRSMSGAEVIVIVNGSSYPLAHQVYHSPTGFEWGYGGSGPADLARSILFDLLGDRGLNPSIYQIFKWEFVSRFPYESFVLKEDEVRRWLAQKFPEETWEGR